MQVRDLRFGSTGTEAVTELVHFIGRKPVHVAHWSVTLFILVVLVTIVRKIR